MPGCSEAAVSAPRPSGLVTLPRLCDGGTAVCVASGPSLVADDVDYVHGKATVIAINDAVRLAPWADVLYSSDKGWWLEHTKERRAFQGLKVRVHSGTDKPTAKPLDGKHCQSCRLRLPQSGRCWCEGLLTLRNGGYKGLALDPEFLVTGNNSGTAAINVAVHLGAKRVLLLGYDMGIDSKGRRHFYDTHAVTVSSPFEQFRKLTATMVEPLKVAGIEVLNCSRRTALDCFPQMPLREALA